MPLWVVFVLGRRRPNNRFTYGYGRAEDRAGIFVVVMVAASAALVADGLHARTDGFTSLAVVIGALGVIAGFPSPTRSSDS